MTFFFLAYPTPMVSVRHREPLFGDIGHTIMNLLVVSRCSLPALPGVIQISSKKMLDLESRANVFVIRDLKLMRELEKQFVSPCTVMH